MCHNIVVNLSIIIKSHLHNLPVYYSQTNKLATRLTKSSSWDMEFHDLLESFHRLKQSRLTIILRYDAINYLHDRMQNRNMTNSGEKLLMMKQKSIKCKLRERKQKIATIRSITLRVIMLSRLLRRTTRKNQIILCSASSVTTSKGFRNKSKHKTK